MPDGDLVGIAVTDYTGVSDWPPSVETYFDMQNTATNCSLRITNVYVRWFDADDVLVREVGGHTSDPSVRPTQVTTLAALYDPATVPPYAVRSLWHVDYVWWCPPEHEPVNLVTWDWYQAPGATEYVYNARVCSDSDVWVAPSVTFTGYNGLGQAVEYHSRGQADPIEPHGCRDYAIDGVARWQMQTGHLTLHGQPYGTVAADSPLEVLAAEVEVFRETGQLQLRSE